VLGDASQLLRSFVDGSFLLVVERTSKTALDVRAGSSLFYLTSAHRDALSACSSRPTFGHRSRTGVCSYDDLAPRIRLMAEPSSRLTSLS